MSSGRSSISKIARPLLPGVYRRTRLFKALDRSSTPVTWITGPPGSGKTTLVASYLDVRKRLAVWCQMDEGDADLASFFFYLGLAARKAAPRIRRPLPLLTPEYQFGIPTFTRRFFEDLFSRLKPPFSFVLDNYQEAAESAPVHEAVVNGLSVLPPGIRAYIISRSGPPSVFARMQANSGISVVGWEQLQMTPDETAAMMRLRSGKPQSKDAARMLQEKTQGWAAGIVLMEALQSRDGGQGEPEALEPGRISDYFAGEIFGKLSRDTRDFLLNTSYFPRFTPAMAEAITGNSRAAQILAELNRRNYFTERRAEPGAVYQYHALFREFLKNLAERSYSAAERSRLMQSAAKLLEDAGKVEDAAELYHASGEWSSLVRIILNHAAELSEQGRSAALEKWLAMVPSQIRDTTPWILFWTGVCRLPFAPSDSRSYFEKAYAIFSEEPDPAGIFPAWAGIMDSFFYEWNDLSPLDRWISELEQHLERFPVFPSPDIEARVSLNFFTALFLRQPGHRQLPLWEKRTETLMEASDAGVHRLMCGHWLLLYNVLIGNIAKADRIFERVRRTSVSAGPAERILANMLQAYYFWAKGYREKSLAAVSAGLDAAHTSGIHIWSFMIAAIGAYSCLSAGDSVVAAGYLEEIANLLDERKALDRSHYHYILGWQALKNQDIRKSQEHADVFLKLGESGPPFFMAFNHIAQAMVLFARGSSLEAFYHLRRAKKIGREGKSALIEYHALLVEANHVLVCGVTPDGRRLLQTALTLGRERQIFNFDWWLPDTMARLCSIALEEGIEPAYVREFVKRHSIFPETPPLHIDAWPWPLRISTLGKFEIRKDDKPLVVSKKVQKKPLQLLKAVIALGRTNVREDRLADLLWPDAEGDAGLKAVNVNTARLRKLLGVSEAIMVQDGTLTLNPRLCWVDVRAFEQILDEGEKGKGGDSPAHGFLEKAISFYRGPFLADEPGPWAVSLREKLRDRFLRSVDALGTRLEQSQKYSEAITLYKRGIEVDDLAEPYYRRMMNCHIALGSHAEALSVYKRCKKTLAAYGVEPSAETEALYKSILKDK